MEIAFLRVGSTPMPVNYETEINGRAVSLTGELRHHEKGLVLFSGRLKGAAQIACDRCAAEFEKTLDEPVELLLASGVFDNPEEEERLPWPVMEMLDGKINLAAILVSELAAFESDYHRCPDCETGPDTFELNQGE
ncbi:MAG: DUF177 domain-containing protein [Campylobacterales bacterium]